jgi:FKBP-type peptidyl-prolyl cis-trans isomerase FkpA
MGSDVESTDGSPPPTMPYRIVIGTIGALCICAALLAGCGDGSGGGRYAESQSTTTQETSSVSEPPVSEMVVDDLTEGTGAAVAAGQNVTVHYTGWLYAPEAAEKKGKQFDSSRTRNQPFNFTVGGRRVIQGWDQGVVGMKVGGERRLTIPASLGYGAGGAGGGLIPPNATLVFDIELLKIN